MSSRIYSNFGDSCGKAEQQIEAGVADTAPSPVRASYRLHPPVTRLHPSPSTHLTLLAKGNNPNLEALPQPPPPPPRLASCSFCRSRVALIPSHLVTAHCCRQCLSHLSQNCI